MQKIKLVEKIAKRVIVWDLAEGAGGRGARPVSRVKDLNPDGRRSGGGGPDVGGGGTVFSQSGSLLVGCQRSGVAGRQLITHCLLHITYRSTTVSCSSSAFVVLCGNGLTSVTAFLDFVCVCSGYLLILVPLR